MDLPLGFISRVMGKAIVSRLRDAVRRRPRPAHVLFCSIDHYEPGFQQAGPDLQRRRVGELLEKFPPLADRHRDAYGRRPCRTWFFPPHDHVNGSLRSLASLCRQGYGEIELHLHHGKTDRDTSENLERQLRLSVRDYSRFGIFGCENGEKRYCFVHGDFSLNNSRRGELYCGVNDELEILQRTGCCADMSFPSCDECNPAQVNSIFYADVRRHVPKSYAWGTAVRAGVCPDAGLMIVQGAGVAATLSRRRLTLGDAIHDRRHPTPSVIDGWISAWVHVAGRADWVFVKNHTHGVPNAASVLGQPMHDGLSYLEQRYNDGKNFILHYVTARELYNLVKAAEAGRQGDPEEYRDYLVKPPVYDSSPAIVQAEPDLLEAVARTYRG